MWLVAVLLPAAASALTPGLTLTQYSHTAWRVRDGYFSAAPVALAQTSDGQLWIGSEAGLVRFDGVQFLPWLPPADQKLPSSRVVSLLGARDGSLWIGLSTGLAQLKGGQLTVVATRGRFNDLLEDAHGVIWAGRSQVFDADSPLCRVVADRYECVPILAPHMPNVVDRLALDTAGDLWFTSTATVCRWRQTGTQCNDLPGRGTAGYPVNALIDLTGTGLVAGAGMNGTWTRAASGWTRLAATTGTQPINAGALLLGADGGLWIGDAKSGLVRQRGKLLDRFTQADGLSSDTINALFEDRQGNVWVATAAGLDRFRDIRVATFTAREGLAMPLARSIAAAADGSLWIAGEDRLTHLKNGVPTVHEAKRDLGDALVDAVAVDARQRVWVGSGTRLLVSTGAGFQAVALPSSDFEGARVRAIIADDQGSVWAASTDPVAALVHLRGDRVVETMSLKQVGSQLIALAPDPAGGVWLARSRNQGLAHFRDGELVSYTDRSPARPLDLATDSRGLWMATLRGLALYMQGRTLFLDAAHGLPCDYVQTVMPLPDGSVWLKAACGLVEISAAAIDEWMADPSRTVPTRLLDPLDGAQAGLSLFVPRGARSSDGRLWFAAENAGVQVVDPARRPAPPPPPVTAVTRLTADRVSYQPGSLARLPALVRDVEIGYTAYNPARPERLRFRYRLSGANSAWHEAGERRAAVFSDLAPGHHRFEIIASLDGDTWSIEPATTEFDIAPAYFQTLWYKLLIATMLVLVLFSLWWWRRRMLAAREEMRRRAEQALRESEERHALAVAGSNEGIFDWEIAGDRLYLAQRTQELLGLAPGEAWQPRKAWLSRLSFHREDTSLQLAALKRHLAGSTASYDVEFRLLVAGGERWFRQRGVALRNAAGVAERMVGFVGDITERKREQDAMANLELRLRQARRFEAMGAMAGGIAHDFNNILGAILGYGQRVQRDLERGSRQRRDLDNVISAGERGRALVESILAVSHGQRGPDSIVHIEGVVYEAIELLRASLPAAVELQVSLQAGCAAVAGDPTDMHRLMMNLGTNALHAMPDGGVLQVRLEPMSLPTRRQTSIGVVEPGPWIVLTVQDSGSGMSPEVIERIFDPFFSTKRSGFGTGLGLSQVLRIVSESRGAIDVHSMPGQGSTFTVYLPHTGDIESATQAPSPAMPRGDGQRVLVVDDEPALAELLAVTLEDLGYRAARAASTEEVLALLRTEPEGIDALIADQQMAGMSGSALIREARRVRPLMPMFLLSGGVVDPADLVAPEAIDELLRKPLATTDLALALMRAFAASPMR